MWCSVGGSGPSTPGSPTYSHWQNQSKFHRKTTDSSMVYWLMIENHIYKRFRLMLGPTRWGRFDAWSEKTRWTAYTGRLPCHPEAVCNVNASFPHVSSRERGPQTLGSSNPGCSQDFPAQLGVLTAADSTVRAQALDTASPRKGCAVIDSCPQARLVKARGGCPGNSPPWTEGVGSLVFAVH